MFIDCHLFLPVLFLTSQSHMEKETLEPVLLSGISSELEVIATERRIAHLCQFDKRHAIELSIAAAPCVCRLMLTRITTLKIDYGSFSFAGFLFLKKDTQAFPKNVLSNECRRLKTFHWDTCVNGVCILVLHQCCFCTQMEGFTLHIALKHLNADLDSSSWVSPDLVSKLEDAQQFIKSANEFVKGAAEELIAFGEEPQQLSCLPCEMRAMRDNADASFEVFKLNVLRPKVAEMLQTWISCKSQWDEECKQIELRNLDSPAAVLLSEGLTCVCLEPRLHPFPTSNLLSLAHQVEESVLAVAQEDFNFQLTVADSSNYERSHWPDRNWLESLVLLPFASKQAAAFMLDFRNRSESATFYVNRCHSLLDLIQRMREWQQKKKKTQEAFHPDRVSFDL